MTAVSGSVWIDGARQAVGDAHVSVRDRGFTLADGVFETMRLHAGVVFRREQHLGRLRHALATLHIPEPPRLEQWLDAALADAGGQDAGVRLTVTRGSGPGGVAPPLQVHPLVAIAVSAPPAFAAAIYERGLDAVIASGRRNPHSITAGLKTLAYTDAVAALIEAQQRGAGEALFLDTDGHCSEATSSNLFVWTGTTLVTPPLSCAALPGITRAAVLELAGNLGVPAGETPFGPDTLAAAPEAFLTSSLRGITPIARVEGAAIGPGRPGPSTRRLADAYRDLVARVCRTAPAA
jgi:branched-chain amino acid aminotransferase